MNLKRGEIPYTSEPVWQQYVGITREYLSLYAAPGWQAEIQQRAQAALQERMGDWGFRLTHLTAGSRAKALQRLEEYTMTCIRDGVTLAHGGDDGPFLDLLRARMPKLVGPPGTPMIVTPPVP